MNPITICGGKYTLSVEEPYGPAVVIRLNNDEPPQRIGYAIHTVPFNNTETKPNWFSRKILGTKSLNDAVVEAINYCQNLVDHKRRKEHRLESANSRLGEIVISKRREGFDV